MTRVAFHVEGGFGAFPGLARDTVVDAEELEPGRRERLLALLAEARPAFADACAARPRGADLRTYVITLHDDDGAERYAVPEPVEEPAVRDLVDFLLDERRGR